MTIQETTTIYLRRQKRKKQTGEDFTPLELVNEMLDKLPLEVWEEGKTYLDPSCGNGNFIVELLKRKLLHKHNPKTVLSTIYGCDIMQDNIKECRLRLLKLVSNYTEITADIIKMVFNNIVFLCTTPTQKFPKARYPKGALDYSFKFLNKASMKDIQPWLDNMKEWLNKVDVDKGIAGDLCGVEEQQIKSEDGEDENDYGSLANLLFTD